MGVRTFLFLEDSREIRATVGYGLGIDMAKILLNDGFSFDMLENLKAKTTVVAMALVDDIEGSRRG